MSDPLGDEADRLAAERIAVDLNWAPPPLSAGQVAEFGARLAEALKKPWHPTVLPPQPVPGDGPGAAMQQVLANAGLHGVILGGDRDRDGVPCQRVTFRLPDGRGMMAEAWFTPGPGSCTHPGRAVGGGQCDTCDTWYPPEPCPVCGRPRELAVQRAEGGGRPPLELWLDCGKGHTEYIGQTQHPAGRKLP